MDPTPKKNLGQHYLKDTSVMTKIFADRPSKAESIVEIGPGPGTLTRNLAQMNLPFLAIEMDERFRGPLCDFLREEQLLFADALEVDWAQVLQNKKAIWLVSNLPYNVASPLLINFLQVDAFSFMTLMFQKEVGEKMLITGSRNEMNSLAALVNTWFSARLLVKIPPGAFLPPPKVDSVAISFTRLENPLLPLSSFDHFESFVRKAFAGKRKQLQTVLKANFAKDLLFKAFEETKIPPAIRAEALSLTQVHALYSALYKSRINS